MNFVALKNTCLHFLYGSVTRTTERANTHLSHLLVCKLFDAPIQSHTCKPRTHYTNTSTEPKFKSFVYSTEWKCQHTCLCMCTNRTRRLTYVMVRIDTDMNEHESRHQWGHLNPTELKMVLIKKTNSNYFERLNILLYWRVKFSNSFIISMCLKLSGSWVNFFSKSNFDLMFCE